MTFNIIIGFLIPWLIGAYLVKKEPKLVLHTVPITAVVAMIINTFGMKLGFWDFNPPIKDDHTISTLPFDVGIYPVVACYMNYWMHRFTKFSFIPLISVSLFTTLCEYVALQMDKVAYGANWNIFFTFGSYLLAYSLVILYLHVLKVVSDTS